MFPPPPGYSPRRLEFKPEPFLLWRCELAPGANPFDTSHPRQDYCVPLSEWIDWLASASSSNAHSHSGDLGLEPLALIFHVSRCGSTLLIRMLGCLEQLLALSEPPLLEQTLAWIRRESIAPARAKILVQAVVAALNYPRGAHRGILIKCDAWSIFDFELLRDSFPHTPRLFLFRDPHEVLASHYRQPGQHMIPGLLSLGEIAVTSPDEQPPWPDYRCRLLTAIYAKAETLVAAGELLAFRYPEFLHEDFPFWLDRLGLSDWSWSHSRLAEVLRRDSKQAGKSFQPRKDPPHPGLETSPCMPQLMRHYEDLSQHLSIRQQV